MPLGVEDKRLRDGAMTASTFYTGSLAPKYGRLYHIYSWSAKAKNRKQWLQIYFIVKTRVTGVATQGRHVSSCLMLLFCNFVWQIFSADYNWHFGLDITGKYGNDNHVNKTKSTKWENFTLLINGFLKPTFNKKLVFFLNVRKGKKIKCFQKI